MSADLEARIVRLEAQAAIADLVHGYARAIRREVYEEVAALFAANGTFEVRTGHPDRAEFTVRSRYDSPQALVAYLLEGKGKPHPVPLIHNLMIEVKGNTASASSVMVASITGTDKEVKGEYRDNFVVVDGCWLFSARIYTVFPG